MSAQLEKIIMRLEGVSKPFKSKAGTSYRARCPAHHDKTPSLVITEKPDGVILLKCFGQHCDHAEILEAVGLYASDLFPTRKLTTGFHPRTGHDHRALCNVASELLKSVLLMLSSGQDESDVRQAVADAVGQLQTIGEALRRAS
jgi:hypothetical protein